MLAQHPQSVQNLVFTRRGSIRTVPVDVPGIGLGQEVVRQYYNSQARQFIFRGCELLSEQAELEWFAMAPARKAAGNAKRQATRAANQAAKQAALEQRMAAADDYLNRVLQNNLAPLIHPAPPQHQQVGNAISSASSFAPRRPTRSNRSEHLPASPVSLSQPAPQQIVAAPNSHQRAPTNSQPPVHNRINELVSSTPIFRRSNARERAPNNLQDQLQAASSQLHNQIVVDQQVDQHLHSEIPAGFSGGTQPNLVVVHQRAPVSKTVVF